MSGKITKVGHGSTVAHAYGTPFVPPEESFREMDKDARRAYVAILYGLACKLESRSRSGVPRWRTAASFHKLIQAGLIAIVSDHGGYSIATPDDMQFNWVN